MKRLFWLVALVVFSFGCSIGTMNVEFTTPTAIPTNISEQDYLSNILGIMGVFQDALSQISVLASNPRLMEASWKAEMRAEGAGMRQGYEELRSITPPTKYVEFHRQLIVAMADCVEATVHIDNSLDTMNVAEVEQAARLFTSCGDKLPKLPKE